MRAFVAGGAGFIGSHTVAKLLRDPAVAEVTVYDNFSSGKREFLPSYEPRLSVVAADISDLGRLTEAVAGHDIVFHYASNPDIARAAKEPDVDFWQGTFLTQNIVEAMRRAGVREIVYSSGSGVYGDTGLTVLREDHAPLLPISTYGASKLAGETLICSYCHMFGLKAYVFRFANVVGARQTHGVVFDFIHRLSEAQGPPDAAPKIGETHPSSRDSAAITCAGSSSQPRTLAILGDGSQSKSYIHVDDILAGIWCARQRATEPYNYFNLSTDDHITVAEIADAVIGIMGLSGVERIYSGGNRGWKGDVPVVRLSSDKIKKLGWRATRSTSEAIRASALAILDETLAARALTATK